MKVTSVAYIACMALPESLKTPAHPPTACRAKCNSRVTPSSPTTNIPESSGGSGPNPDARMWQVPSHAAVDMPYGRSPAPARGL